MYAVLLNASNQAFLSGFLFERQASRHVPGLESGESSRADTRRCRLGDFSFPFFSKRRILPSGKMVFGLETTVCSFREVILKVVSRWKFGIMMGVDSFLPLLRSNFEEVSRLKEIVLENGLI